MNLSAYFVCSYKASFSCQAMWW